MKILVTDTNYIIGQANESITFGLFENDPNHKWALDGGRNGYVIDGNVLATDIADTIYTIQEVDSIPDDYWIGKLLFVDGVFVENPYYVAPPKTDAERIAELEAQNITLGEQIANTELTMIENYEAQEEINAQTENALIEIYEMMED